MRRVAVNILRALGYQVREAEDGPSALAILQQPDPIDLLFTDLIMPNGIERAGTADARARALRPGLKALFTSGYSEQFIRGQGPDRGGRRAAEQALPVAQARRGHPRRARRARRVAARQSGDVATSAYLCDVISRRPSMLWSVNIGRIAGTAVRIHVTFLLFLGWIFIASWYSGGRAAWSGLAFMILLFACVLAHEFGHIFTARVRGRDAAATRHGRRIARQEPDGWNPYQQHFCSRVFSAWPLSKRYRRRA